MLSDYFDFDIINYERLARETSPTPLELDYRPQPAGDAYNAKTARQKLLGLATIVLLLIVAVYFVGSYALNPWVLLVSVIVAAVAVVLGMKNRATTSTITRWSIAFLALPLAVAGLFAVTRVAPTSWLLYVPVALVAAYVVDRLATHYVLWTLAAPAYSQDTRKHWHRLWATRFVPIVSLLRPFLLTVNRKLRQLASAAARQRAKDADFVLDVRRQAKKKGISDAFEWLRESQPDFARERWDAAVADWQEQRAIRDLAAKPKGYLLLLYPVVLAAPFVAIFFLTFLSGLPAVAMVLLLLLTILVWPLVKHYRDDDAAASWLANKAESTQAGIASWFTYGALTPDAPGVFKSPAGNPSRRLLLTGVAVFLLSFYVLPATLFFDAVHYLKPQPWTDQAEQTRHTAFARDYLQSEQPTPRDIPEADIPKQAPDEPVAHFNERLDKARLDSMRRLTREYWHRHPAFFLIITCHGMGQGQPIFFSAFFVSLLSAWAFPPVAFLFAAATVLAYLSSAILPALARTGPQDDERTDWHFYAERLRRSANRLESRHLWLGTHAQLDYPVLLDRQILSEHAHILGDTGSGKTALGVTPLVTQLIRRADSPVVVIDLKGDNALFQTVRQEAAAAKLPFRFFTNELNKTTYTFNPFLQGAHETLSLNQLCENMLDALNLNHGEGYGRSYYSRVARHWLHRALRQHPHVKSFTELHEIAADREAFARPGDHKDAFELLSVIEILASFDQLNITPQTRAYPAEVLDHAIHMPRVMAANQVVYFWLPSAVESAAVREIAKLALYALLQASYDQVRRTGQAKQTYLVIDEFQRIASANFKIILEQARSMGIGAILANQTIADLNTPDVDLRRTVQTNTRFKQCFSATDVEQQETLMTASGEAIDMHRSVTTSSGGQGRSQSVTYAEYTRPRLQRNDIIRASDDPYASIVHIHRGSGYSQYSGFSIPVVGSYAVTRSVYESRQRAAWPEAEPGTIAVTRPPLEPYPTSEQRIEAAKAAPPAAVVPAGQPDYGVELERIRLSQLQQAAQSPPPPTPAVG